MSFSQKILNIPTAEDSLPGREMPITLTGVHAVNGNKITPPFPEQMSSIVVGMGCFWGAERIFWELDGVWTTAVGYSGGHTPNPTYEEVCSGTTGHAEVVEIDFDEKKVSFENLLSVFWDCHDPTQLNYQGPDIGTQYRTAIFFMDEEQQMIAISSKTDEQKSGKYARVIVTEISPAKTFWRAEEYHQQYIAKNRNRFGRLFG